MTLNEFKSWFEGFTENIRDLPSKKQWARIQERLEDVDGEITTYPVYIDQYWRYAQPYYYGVNGHITDGTTTTTSANAQTSASNHVVNFSDIGRAEYTSISI